MSKNVSLWGANYSNVPAINVPQTGGGTARFTDTSPTTAIASDVAQGKTFFLSDGTQTTGTASGGGGTPLRVGYATTTIDSSSAQAIYFENLEGRPTSCFVMSSEDFYLGSGAFVASIAWDGVEEDMVDHVHTQVISNYTNQQVRHVSGMTLMTADDAIGFFAYGTDMMFPDGQTYELIYTYGGNNIGTKDVQVGSGATSITFSGLEAEPKCFSVIFKSYFSTSSGYQRVVCCYGVDGDMVGLEMDSYAHYSNAHWSYTYNNGSLTVSSQGTNAGGYFHQPGYYQLTYAIDDSGANYQAKTVTPTTSQQTVTADTGYDALSRVTVNAIPSEYIIPTGNYAITQNGNNINIAQYATVSVNVSGGSLTVATKTLTNTSTTQTLSFSSLSGQPKYWFLRATTNVSSSGSTTYYYVTDLFYDGTNIKGNTFRIGSTRRVQNITSGVTQSYSGNTLTITAGSVSTATPGQFYGTTNFGYELVYVY